MLTDWGVKQLYEHLTALPKILSVGYFLSPKQVIIKTVPLTSMVMIWRPEIITQEATVLNCK